jgi:hypothetical protein
MLTAAKERGANALHVFCTHFSAISAQFPVLFRILPLTRLRAGRH